MKSPSWLKPLLRLGSIGLAAAHTVIAMMRQSMNADGINYLDIGAAYWRGDWDAAINGIWSPLYAWIVGTVVELTDPSIVWEFPVVQITNFVIFLMALFSFEFFWRELSKLYYGKSATSDDAVQFSPVLWTVLGYSLFTYASLNLIEIWSVTPDMLVAVAAYLAAGLVLRFLTARSWSASAGALLGVVLGFGYLAKAAMFPLALVLCILTLLRGGSFHERVKRAGCIAGVFVLVASPFMATLSLKAGELTFSGVGSFTYLKHVNNMPYPNFLPRAQDLGGTPEHAPRRIFDEPPVYEFGEPIGGTYPMAYDPAYWTAGVRPDVGFGPQLQALATSGMFWFDLFVREQGGFLAILGVLVILSVRSPTRLTDASPAVLLILWAMSAFGMYSLVHLAPRYIAPFVVLFWAGLLTTVRLPADSMSGRLTAWGGAALVFFVCVNIVALNVAGLAGLAGFRPSAESAVTVGQFSDGPSANHPELAMRLLDQGLERNDRIGFIGYSFSAHWARLARLKIVAEIYPEYAEVFWESSPEVQQRALAAIYASGAVAVIAEPTGQVPPAGWREIGDSGFLLHRPDQT